MTEKTPTVSVIIPTCNWVGRVVQSMIGGCRLPGVGAIL